MPILSEEPNIFPESLLDGLADEPSDRHWWALYTRARQEKAVVRRLLVQGIPFYMPLVKKRSIRRGRRVSSYIPLFSNYVFLYGSEEERVASLATNRISQVLAVRDPQLFSSDLRRIRRLIASDAPLTVEARLIPGNRVRVRFGPMVGLEGTVMKRRGQTRLLVDVRFLQQGASVEIDDAALEPID